MNALQELIQRGRFIFRGAPKRLEVFKLINGKSSTREIAIKTGRNHRSVLNDIKKLKDFELIQEKKKCDKTVKKDGCTVYEKNPLLKHISYKYYFEDVTRTPIPAKKLKKRSKAQKEREIYVPDEREILDICKEEGGEDQIYEFKSPGTSVDKITKEIAAFLHTKRGGIIFYGVENDGSIIGSDIKRQDFDQKIQNSVRNTISPPPNIRIEERKVMKVPVLLIIVPPWNRENLYQYKERFYIRKGTNTFALTSDEIQKLSRGEYIV